MCVLITIEDFKLFKHTGISTTIYKWNISSALFMTIRYAIRNQMDLNAKKCSSVQTVVWQIIFITFF